MDNFRWKNKISDCKKACLVSPATEWPLTAEAERGVTSVWRGNIVQFFTPNSNLWWHATTSLKTVSLFLAKQGPQESVSHRLWHSSWQIGPWIVEPLGQAVKFFWLDSWAPGPNYPRPNLPWTVSQMFGEIEKRKKVGTILKSYFQHSFFCAEFVDASCFQVKLPS